MARDHACEGHLHHADSNKHTVVRCPAAGHLVPGLSLQDRSKTGLLALDSLIFVGFLQSVVARGAW